jgi:hypothetical protein
MMIAAPVFWERSRSLLVGRTARTEECYYLQRESSSGAFRRCHCYCAARHFNPAVQSWNRAELSARRQRVARLVVSN